MIPYGLNFLQFKKFNEGKARNPEQSSEHIFVLNLF